MGRWSHGRNLDELFSGGKGFNIKLSEPRLIIDNASQHKLLCVAIPNYNRAEMLKMALDSVANQNLNPEEYNVLIVDDSEDKAEKDKALNIAKAYPHANIRFFQNKERIGLFANMNRCVELANSDWVCFLHNDDLLYPDALSRAKLAIESIANENAASIYPYHDYIRKDHSIILMNQITTKRPLYKWLLELEHGKIKKRTMKKLQLGDNEGCVAPSCGALFHKDKFLKYGGFSDGYGSGDVLLLYGLSSIYDCYIINESWGMFRWEENESLNSETIAAYIRERDILLKYFSKYGKKGLLGRLDLYIQKKTFYFDVIKKFVNEIEDKKIIDFLNEYAPEFKFVCRGKFWYILFRARSYIVNKYILMWNIFNGRKLGYKTRMYIPQKELSEQNENNIS